MNLQGSSAWQGLAAVAVIAMGLCGCSSTTVVGASPVTGNITWTPVTSCGTTITQPGLYRVEQSLMSTAASVDCIQIKSAGVVLGLNSNVTLKGPGKAAANAGIDVAPDAYGVRISFGQGDTIEGFGIGIEAAGSGVTIAGPAPDAVEVTGNVAQGVFVDGGSNVSISYLVSEENGGSGLELFHATGVTVDGLNTVQNNKGYGVWVRSSSGNQFFDINAITNTLGGFYTGELSGDTPASSKNVFVGDGAVQNGGNGFTLSAGDSYNVVANSQAQADTGKDAFDGNASCGTNQWVNNEFTTTNADCIQ